MLSSDTLSTVTSPANVSNGTLARLAQAAYFLGYVLRLTNEPKGDSSSLTEEVRQLDRTIWSLINLSYVEGQMRRMAVCGQTSLCYRSVSSHPGIRLLANNWTLVSQLTYVVTRSYIYPNRSRIRPTSS